MSAVDREWLNARIKEFLADPLNGEIIKASAYANLDTKKRYAAELELTIEKRIFILARQHEELRRVQEEIKAQEAELKKFYGE